MGRRVRRRRSITSATTPAQTDWKYSLDTLRQHTRDIRLTNGEIVRQQRGSFDYAIRSFETYLRTLETNSNVESNVRKLLATKFFNHWYSALLLEGVPISGGEG